MLNLGIDYTSNPFSHVAEFEAGVPYCYNKFTKIKYFKNKKKILKTFSTFVRYTNLGVKNDYSKLKKKLSSKKIIRSIRLGSGNIHLYSVLKYYNLLINELKKDQFFLLKKPPRFKKGRLPFA
jgi:aminoglycoside N3'-acetyltransferase